MCTSKKFLGTLGWMGMAALILVGVGGCANNCRTITTTTTWVDARSINQGVAAAQRFGAVRLPGQTEKLNGQTFSDGDMSAIANVGNSNNCASTAQTPYITPNYRPPVQLAPVPQTQPQVYCPQQYQMMPPPPIYTLPPSYSNNTCW